MRAALDLAGRTFGRLTAIARRQHRVIAAPPAVALPLHLWRRAGGARRVAPGRPHAILPMPACRGRA